MEQQRIRIGLAGWGDHDAIYPPGTAPSRKLSLYGRQFAVVEVDSSFYAIPSAETVQRWVNETPGDFGFVVKAFQSMTGHERETGRRVLNKLLAGEPADSGGGREEGSGRSADGEGSDGAGADEKGSNEEGSNEEGSDGEGSNEEGSDGGGLDGEGSDGEGLKGEGSDTGGSDGGVLDGEGSEGEGLKGEGSDTGGSDGGGAGRDNAGEDAGGSAVRAGVGEAGSGEEAEQALFQAFREAFAPMERSGKLKAYLFQYPPWFGCTKENVAVLRRAKRLIGDAPAALEFRHQSWFAPEMREKTLAFMAREGWMHAVCDEPQAGVGSVPTVPVPTHPQRTIVRLHGRNVGGWNAAGNGSLWRAVRYLYDYNDQELEQWKSHLLQMLETTGEICVIFNNNSGGHGVGNAKRLMAMMGQTRGEPPPEQLSLW